MEGFLSHRGVHLLFSLLHPILWICVCMRPLFLHPTSAFSHFIFLPPVFFDFLVSWVYVVHFLFHGFYVGFALCLGPTHAGRG